MTKIEDLRPLPQPVDAAWSAATLNTIFAEPAGGPARVVPLKPKAPKWRMGLAAAATCAAAVGLFAGLGPTGSPGTTPASAQFAGAVLATHPGVGAGEYLHIKRVMKNWGYGGAGVIDPDVAEYWVPGDRTSSWVERSVWDGEVEHRKFSDWGPDLYVNHSSDPAELVEELRAWAEAEGSGSDLDGVFNAAWWVVNDPVAPQSLKDEVMVALAQAEGTEISNSAFEADGLRGQVLTVPGDTGGYVVDPETLEFRGYVSYPEKDETWVGPEEPMWTLTFEYAEVDSAPKVWWP